MKKTIALLIWFLLFSIIFGYSLVYWKWTIWSEIETKEILSKNIFLNSTNLNDTLFRFKTNLDISEYEIQSNCNIKSEFMGKKDEDNYFRLTFLDDDCYNGFVFLKNGEEILSNISFKLKFFSDWEIFNVFSDLSTDALIKSNNKLKSQILEYSKYEKYNELLWLEYFEFMRRNRFYNELIYKQKIIENILNKRELSYIIPVEGYNISEKHSKIPNASRWYRADYTDGIHHGWDIDAPIWTKVISIDDWVVIRVVRDFSYNDLWKLKYSNSLTYEEKLRNLDLLRWNQVWIKTTKGDVIFYSHLDKVYSNIKEGRVIPAWMNIWTIWISWIPDKSYTDYHLHFSIHMNPYDITKAWKYDIVDYMKWDWYYKWKDKEYVLENQNKLFDRNKSLTYEEKYLR